jgi:hypothetical protein
VATRLVAPVALVATPESAAVEFQL